MIKFSVSKNIASPKKAYQNEEGLFCFGKATTYDFKPITYDTLQDVLPELLVSSTSPYIYDKGVRSSNTVVGVGNLVMLDIDSKHNIQVELFNVLKQFNFQYALLPTQNHLVQLNGQAMYKYRLILPVLNIATVQEYKAFIHWFIAYYKIPNVDGASWSDARFYAPTLPRVGEVFSVASLANTAHTPLTITEDILRARARELGLLQGDSIQIDPNIYPQQLEGGWLQYTPDMAQFAPQDCNINSTHTIPGDTFTTVYEGMENTISRYAFEALTEKEQVAIGDVASKLTNSSRVFCRCPTAHLHTNPEDTRYAWLLKTGSGESRLYCASDHCKQEFGDFRTIQLPPFEAFVADPNYYRTITRLEQLVERVESNLLTLLTNYICSWQQVNIETWHEKVAYAKDIMYSELIDENALKVMCLLISKERGVATYVYDINLAGCVQGRLTTKMAKLLMRGGWFTYLFKAGFNVMLDAVGNKDIGKPTLFNLIVSTIEVDIAFVEIVASVDRLKPSEQLDGRIQVDYSGIGRKVHVTTNSFDTPVFRRKAELERLGVLKDARRYTEVVQAFTRHWTLPYGAVEYEGMMIDDLPTLLILFNTLNMFTDGVTNQRHSTVVITAPASIGKTSLIKNFFEAGLSNDDSHGADLFGYDGLYPKSVDDVKNRLWVTGDELSPKMMSSMSQPTLLANLTRLEVNVNIKGRIDSSFTAYGKVLWGARAWDAISSGSQATELRSRLLAITYDDEHFVDRSFIEMCEIDTGDIDSIIQHRLIVIYEYIKALVLGIDIKDRISVFNRFKTNFKAVYSGLLDYTVNTDIDLTESGEINIREVKPVKVVSDAERDVGTVLKALLAYRARLIAKPFTGRDGGALAFTAVDGDSEGLELDTYTRRNRLCEEIMYKSAKTDTPLIAVPNTRNLNENGIVYTALEKELGESRAKGVVYSVKPSKLRAISDALMTEYSEPLRRNARNRDIRVLTLPGGVKVATTKHRITLLLFPLEGLEKYLENKEV